MGRVVSFSEDPLAGHWCLSLMAMLLDLTLGNRVPLIAQELALVNQLYLDNKLLCSTVITEAGHVTCAPLL